MFTSFAALVSVLRMGHISSQVGKGFLPSTSAESLLHLTDFLRGRLDRFVLVNNLMVKHIFLANIVSATVPCTLLICSLLGPNASKRTLRLIAHCKVAVQFFLQRSL